MTHITLKRTISKDPAGGFYVRITSIDDRFITGRSSLNPRTAMSVAGKQAKRIVSVVGGTRISYMTNREESGD